MFRYFSKDTEALAHACEELFCNEEFEIIGNRVGGGSIAFPVRLNSGALAWVKPAVAAGGNERTAAHEKIVADLAHKLGFAVAPAMLSRQIKGHGLPQVVALSFAALKQPSTWNGVSGRLTDEHKKALSTQLSAILALHCWVDDHDHDWNEGNALFECEANGAARAVFYDYGHSLTHAWNPPTPAPIRDWTRRQGPWDSRQNSSGLILPITSAPMVGTFGYCARASCGHATAPPSAAISSRRPMAIVMRLLSHEAALRNDSTPRAWGLHVSANVGPSRARRLRRPTANKAR